jgi:hypothetical protein
MPCIFFITLYYTKFYILSTKPIYSYLYHICDVFVIHIE